jgi:hypothetical protein
LQICTVLVLDLEFDGLTSIVNFWNTLASGLFQFSSIRSVLRLWKFSWKLEFVVSHEILDSLTCYYDSIWTLNKLLDFISIHFTHLILWLYCNFEGFDPMLFTNLVIGRSYTTVAQIVENENELLCIIE